MNIWGGRGGGEGVELKGNTILVALDYWQLHCILRGSTPDSIVKKDQNKPTRYPIWKHYSVLYIVNYSLKYWSTNVCIVFVQIMSKLGYRGTVKEVFDTIKNDSKFHLNTGVSSRYNSDKE